MSHQKVNAAQFFRTSVKRKLFLPVCFVILSANLAFTFRLLSAVLRTSEVESRATRASLTELLSPQMGKDIMWFLRRWAKTYLLVDEKLYEQV